MTHRLLWQPRRVLLTLGLIAVLVALFCAPGTAMADTDPGSIGVRLVDVPTAQRNDPRAQLYVVDHLAPGATIHRRIEVSNSTSATAHVGLYSAAATIEKGTFRVADGHTPNDVSTWTSIRPEVLDIPAGQTATAVVTINVAKEAAPGEQYGAVWAEVSSPANGGVVEVNRVGVRLYISVGPGGAPPANFVVDSLTAQRTSDGRPVVVASVHNTGGRALDMSGTLLLSGGPAGLSAGPFPANLGVTLGIGATEPVTVPLDSQLPAGPWSAQLTLRSGLVERTVAATITFPATGQSTPVKPRPTPSASHGASLLPIAVAIGAALSAMAAALWVLRSRSRSSRR